MTNTLTVGAASGRQGTPSPSSGPSLGASSPGLPGHRAAVSASSSARLAAAPGDQAGTSSLAPLKEEVALPQPSKATSAGAAFTRSLLLFIGFLFRRPSKLFRPNRLDTWAGLRRLAESADQNLSPTFVRGILKLKGGPLILAASLVPPLLVNTTLGFLLFSSHSLFSLWLARLPYFHRGNECKPEEEDDFINFSSIRDPLGSLDGDYGDVIPGASDEEEEISFENILRGPKIIPKHPTLLSAIAGAGAGVIQGVAFTPIENVVRLIQQSASSLTAAVVRFLHLPTPKTAQALDPAPSSPLEALRTFVSHDTWYKSQPWWTGWRWAVARDAASYGIFFATFDVTRRVGLRVKSIASQRAGGPTSGTPIAMTEQEALRAAALAPPSETPTSARLAQAVTIVTGGVVAAHFAELAGRPFRACQRYSGHATAERARLRTEGKPIPERYRHPIKHVYRQHGLRAFWHRDEPLETKHKMEAKAQGPVRVMARIAGRVVWRVASVGPWGIGFLMFAWIGGEV